jgi:type III pantothenate kinase
MNVLVIDIGNTRTKLGFFRGRTLVRTSIITNKPIPDSNTFLEEVGKVSGTRGIREHAVGGCVISSVIPLMTKRATRLVRRLLGIAPLVISGALDTGLQIRYVRPSRLGADRICGAVAAFLRFGGPVIVIDLGTAITYDVVTAGGVFLGGAIAPGIQAAAAALQLHTAQLPLVSLRFPRTAVARSTVESIQSGILFGAIDAIDGMVGRIKKITGRRTKVILTGGGAQLVKMHLRTPVRIVPSLVLDGARLIHERVVARKQHPRKTNGKPKR